MSISGTLGFINGFLWNIKSKEQFVTRPLYTCFDGAIYGTIYGIGGAIIEEFFPPKLRFIPQIVLCMSAAYSIVKIVKDENDR